MELNGAKDIEKTDKGDGKEKYRGLQGNCLEPRKHHHKEELKKELDLVSGLIEPLSPMGPAGCCPSPGSLPYKLPLTKGKSVSGI